MEDYYNITLHKSRTFFPNFLYQKSGVRLIFEEKFIYDKGRKICKSFLKFEVRSMFNGNSYVDGLLHTWPKWLSVDFSGELVNQLTQVIFALRSNGICPFLPSKVIMILFVDANS